MGFDPAHSGDSTRLDFLRDIGGPVERGLLTPHAALLRQIERGRRFGVESDFRWHAGF